MPDNNLEVFRSLDNLSDNEMADYLKNFINENEYQTLIRNCEEGARDSVLFDALRNYIFIIRLLNYFNFKERIGKLLLDNNSMRALHHACNQLLNFDQNILSRELFEILINNSKYSDHIANDIMVLCESRVYPQEYLDLLIKYQNSAKEIIHSIRYFHQKLPSKLRMHGNLQKFINYIKDNNEGHVDFYDLLQILDYVQSFKALTQDLFDDLTSNPWKAKRAACTLKLLKETFPNIEKESQLIQLVLTELLQHAENIELSNYLNDMIKLIQKQKLLTLDIAIKLIKNTSHAKHILGIIKIIIKEKIKNSHTEKEEIEKYKITFGLILQYAWLSKNILAKINRSEETQNPLSIIKVVIEIANKDAMKAFLLSTQPLFKKSQLPALPKDIINIIHNIQTSDIRNGV